MSSLFLSLVPVVNMGNNGTEFNLDLSILMNLRGQFWIPTSLFEN